jgi:type II secretory pathway pseudopilin PulG
MELMVVVVIIGILAALAIPSLSLASYERDTYNDAGSIMQLFREARARAVGRGSATLIAMTASATDRGTFLLYEAVAPNPNGVAGTLTPVATCKFPTSWPLANLTPIDGANLNGPIEQLGGIVAQPNSYSPSKTAFAAGYICYTPLGRSYVTIGASTSPTFGGQLPMLNPIGIDVTHTNGATTRTVVVPPNGMARIFSHL